MSNGIRWIVACVMTTMFLSGSVSTSAAAERAVAEPNVEIAKIWWSELSNKWVCVGWKDNMSRFTVLWNGTIICMPNLNKRAAKYGGPEWMLTFVPTVNGVFNYIGTDADYPTQDDGSTIQGWNDCDAPVLWTEWNANGFLLRQEVFGIIPGAKDVETGIEPLFAWIRLSVKELCEGIVPEESAQFAIQINRSFVFPYCMSTRNNLRWNLPNRKYNELKAGSAGYDAASGFHILEADGKVRMGVAAGQSCKIEFVPKYPEGGSPLDEKDAVLWVTMEAKKGAHVDLLIPMLPADRTVFDEQLAIGFDNAQQLANAYWSKKPATAAVFDCPEDYINQVIRRNLQFAEIVAEKDPATGDYSMLNGGWFYAGYYATPTTIALNMVMDPMGYHGAVEKYLRVIKKAQGTVQPPGKYYFQHPGCLGSPQHIVVAKWVSDHGAILHTIASHALMTGDPEFIEEYTPVIVKACECIRDFRAIKHEGVPGLMPPGQATDWAWPMQGVWSDGWTYKGLTTAVRFLRSIGHPSAEEFAAQARDYKAAFVKAYREKVATMLTWTDSNGQKHHMAPLALYGDDPRQVGRWCAYGETGPIFLVWAGLMDADDPLMKEALLWWREGPQTKLYRFDSTYSQLPTLIHEISHFEPVYSWNVFHSWQLGDRAKYLEGMYSMFLGTVSQQTYTLCESRGGMTGLSPILPCIWLARLAVIDDQIKEDELHLMRLMPLAWLRTDRTASFENVPTMFGPVTLRARLTGEGKNLDVGFTSKFRGKPKRVVLYVPPVSGLKSISLNGRPLKWDGKSESIDLAP